MTSTSTPRFFVITGHYKNGPDLLTKLPHVWGWFGSEEAARAEVSEAFDRIAESFNPDTIKVMSYEEHLSTERDIILGWPLTEVDQEHWEKALESLPPMNWHRRDGVERFTICEPVTGSFHRQYAQRDGRFATKYVDITDRSTWITADSFNELTAQAREHTLAAS